jgi:hypothetical protein
MGLQACPPYVLCTPGAKVIFISIGSIVPNDGNNRLYAEVAILSPAHKRKSTFRDEVPMSIAKVTICFLSTFGTAHSLNR